MRSDEAKYEVNAKLLNVLTLTGLDFRAMGATSARDTAMLIRQMRRHARRLAREIEDDGGDASGARLQYLDHRGEPGVADIF